MSNPESSIQDVAAPGRHRRRRANWGLRIGIAFVLVTGLTVAAGTRYYSWCQGSGGAQTAVSFTVPQGAAGDDVMTALHEQGVIRCSGIVGRALLHRSGKASEIRAGTYDLTTNMTLDAVLAVLTKAPPPVPTVRLTIPEGYRLTQIADRVQQVLGIPAKKFLATANSGAYSLPPYLPQGTATPEGFLFPQTYQFAKKQTSADDVISRLVQEFGTEVASEPWQNAEKLGVTPYDVIVIASMIEREAKVDGDRPLIAAVIYNRLKLNMTLGIDATLLYDDPTPGDGELSASDLLSNSPYNTRVHTGLPPTPIASPGLKSIDAALNPANVDYLYYVLCGADGSHKFSSDYGTFLQDKARCLG